MDWYQTYQSLTKRNWIILSIMTISSYFIMNSALTPGIITGGLIIIINFNFFQRILRRSFQKNSQRKSKKAALILGYYLRFIALGIIIYILIRTDWIHPIGLVIGLSTVVFSIVSFGISNAFKIRTGEAT